MIKFREANENDCSIILDFINKMAIYEKLEHMVVNTEELIKEEIFRNKRAEVLLGYDKNDKCIGFILFFHNYSTFLGRSGIYIEDIFVLEEERNKGYGKLFFNEIRKIAKERKCGRLEWSCLNWNEPSIKFYLSQGAEPLNEWTTFRIVL